MRKYRLALLAPLAASSLFFCSSEARADRLQPGSHDIGVVSVIGKGVKELSLEMMIVANVDKTGGANKSSSTRISAVGGPVFRYFIIDNLALSLNVGGFFKSSDDVTKTSDVGGVGTIGANYYARLGGGMFLSPGLGAGGFFGGRNAGVDPNVARSSIAGFAARAGLGLAFYASSRFNLFARPEAVILIGSSKLKGVQNAESAPFTSVDVGFNVGLSYVF